VAGLVFLGSIVLTSFLPLVFFPKADKNIIYLDIQSEHAANLGKTEELAKTIDAFLLEQNEVKQITTSIGDGLPKFFMTVPSSVKSLDTAQTMVSLDLKNGGRFKNTTISGGVVKVKELEQAEPADAPLLIRVTGDDRERLREVTDEIKNIARGIKGTVNIDDDAGEKEYQFLIDIDTGRASQVGLARYDIQREINIALSGKIVSLLRMDSGEEYDILVKSEIDSIADLENLAIKSEITGQKVVLKQVAQVRLSPQYTIIKRFDRERVITVLSDVKLGYSAVDIQNELQKKMIDLNTEGVNITFDGEKSKIKKHFGNLGTAAAFALFIIYIIMLIQFSSLSQPLIILVSIPLSAIGSILGLLIFRQSLSFTALLGVVSLIGVVINNAIILIDYINWQRKQGKDIEESCRNAVEKRVRPILLTTATTILGLIPLIFSGTLFVPMAVSLMCGLLVSTLLTLVVIPVIYTLVEN
jgi:multidrug efflux pump subunit AcrB